MNDLDAALHSLAAQGLDVGRMLQASRMTAQGELRWRIAVRDDGARLFGGAMPTLIEWGAAHPADALSAAGATLASITLRAPVGSALRGALRSLRLDRVGTTADAAAPAFSVDARDAARPRADGLVPLTFVVSRNAPMQLLTSEEIATARAVVGAIQPPTPTLRWPLLDARLGARAWVKHENHTRVGAFKLRGGAVYLHELVRREPGVRGVISATRGNHGQSIALAAASHGLACTIVVPRGNSVEKNTAMRALGATLVEHGEDFQQSREHAAQLAAERGLHMVPSFHRDLVRGVASYWMEFFEAVAGDPPAVVFVPIGQGSGISACACARAVSKSSARIVGVVSAHATAYLDSVRAGRAIEMPVTTKLADGMACRVPDTDALALILREVDQVDRRQRR